MQAKAAPSSPPPPPPPRRSIDPAACARREARVASLVRSSRDASPVSSVASTPVKTPVESEALTTTSPDVVSAAAASLRRAPARFSTSDSPDAKTVNSRRGGARGAFRARQGRRRGRRRARGRRRGGEARLDGVLGTSRRRSNCGCGGAAVLEGRGGAAWGASAANPWSGPGR